MIGILSSWVAITIILTSTVLAQIPPTIDHKAVSPCAIGCLKNNTDTAKGCTANDTECFCSNIPYINSLTCCVQSSCGKEDQQATLQYVIQVCNTYNISIPNFLECSSTKLGSGETSKLPSSTVMNIGPVSTTTAGGPVPTSQEAQLLTGNCTIPYIATVSTLQNSILNIPWIGCSNQHLDCCPWHMDSQVPLTACPQDYATTSGTCCPTSWSVYSSAIAGQTPCFTTTSAMLVLPSLSPANSEISSNRVFTSGFILESPSTGLSKKAKIGISSGIGFGVLLVLAIVAFTKYRQHKAKEVRLATVYRSQSYVTQDQSPTALQSGVQFSPTLMRHNTVHNKHLSRLATDCPSPLSQRSGNDSPIITPPPVPPKAPMELPGDTILNAHHPAMKSTPHGIELE